MARSVVQSCLRADFEVLSLRWRSPHRQPPAADAHRTHLSFCVVATRALIYSRGIPIQQTPDEHSASAWCCARVLKRERMLVVMVMISDAVGGGWGW